jgi:hypothetical protein
MRRTFQTLLALLILTAPVRAEAAGPRPSPDSALAVQVLLDRAGYSPGRIDGRFQEDTAKAVRAFQEAHGLPVTGEVDRQTWDDLHASSGAEPTRAYTLPDPAPPLLQLAESFHASPALLESLNPGARFAPGETVRVPNVRPERRLAARRDGLVLVLSRGDGTLVVERGGDVVFFAPATVDARRLPAGRFRVTGVAREQAERARVALDRAGCAIGAAAGCVSLSSWDALAVAELVQEGTEVIVR